MFSVFHSDIDVEQFLIKYLSQNLQFLKYETSHFMKFSVRAKSGKHEK